MSTGQWREAGKCQRRPSVANVPKDKLSPAGLKRPWGIESPELGPTDTILEFITEAICAGIRHVDVRGVAIPRKKEESDRNLQQLNTGR